jgi:hypothetical protein
MNDENERVKRIGKMCNMIEQMGRENGSGEQYLMALTICAGRHFLAMPDASMKMKTLHQFMQLVREFSEKKHVNEN